MDASKIEIAKTLAGAHLESIYDKYLVIGFQVDRGDDFMSNCTAEQLGLLLMLFNQRLQQTQTLPNPQDEPIN